MAAGRSGMSGYDSRYAADNGSFGYVNPEYYDRNYAGYGHEPQYSGAIDYREDSTAKKQKISNLTICVDYLRGHCSKGAHCPKAHVDFVESIDEREIMSKVKFCHDFQNRGVCTRPSCRFLHVTRREEDEFLLTGYIPQSVFERGKEWNEGGRSEAYTDYGAGQGRGAYGGWPRGGRGGGRGRGTPAHRAAEQYWTGQAYAFSPAGWDNHQKPLGNHQQRLPEARPGPAARQSIPVTFGSYCIDYLKGTCNKQDSCQLRHVEVVDAVDRPEIIKAVFCHDFINKRCPRSFCKYIHANRDEEQFFSEKGYFSEVLCQRNQSKLFYSDICIENLRNQCIRGESCHFRHTNYVEEREERICLTRSIFCHDYQEGQCSRQSCKLLHTSQDDEAHFLRTGSLPEHLCTKMDTQGTADFDPAIESIAPNVCREFVKNKCNRGAACKFYHPKADELERIIAYQQNKSSSSKTVTPSTSSAEMEQLKQENAGLKERNHQLERLLADACHCITLAVGDQNPAIQTLMQTIAGMAPESSLAKKEDMTEGNEQGATSSGSMQSSLPS